MEKELIDGDKVIEYIQDCLCGIRDGESLEEMFNQVCSAKVKYIGDDMFELTYAEDVK